ncbi:hypothetical protein [Marinobacterium marinum]|uniref:AbiTii domain-containing protein n=1 Tax=Marinobacterium marinum TaxID=2756129 RepID=A0A7W2ABE6_9GAMM|nr:hypothetical protein [Marinobacterium marinum]MBA4501359.1 hypothetical protein [Marinobacterium marinum]
MTKADIRGDFKEVESQIARLLAIGEGFREKDRDWSHMKNKEDWERNLYKISDDRNRATWGRIYSDGRDMAGFMSDALCSINYDITTYPTLTRVIERFDGSWIDSDLTPIVEDAIKVNEKYELNCWAFDQMVTLFKDQQSLAQVVKSTLELLKDSDLYKLENGIPVNKETSNITISNVSGSNIAISSSNVDQKVEGTDAIFADLMAAIDKADIDKKEALKESVSEMQEKQGTSGFGAAYKRFTAAAANHMTIVAPFIPALSALL